MSLIGEERKRKILERLNREGKINTARLAEELNVSTETIRIYLDELETQNKLKKVYGGAVKVSMEELPFTVRDISNQSEKHLIGLEASKLVEDNDVIILDEGSTVLKVVEFIAHKRNLTIVTPSLPIVSILSDMELKGLFDGKIVLIGGIVTSRHNRVAGIIAENFVSNIYAKKAFISTVGVSLDGGITDFDSETALLSSRFIQNSQYKYVLCDHTKLEKRSFYRICDFTDLTGIICDTKPPQEWLQRIESAHMEWITPSDG